MTSCEQDAADVPDTSGVPDTSDVPDTSPLPDVAEDLDGGCDGRLLYYIAGCADVSPTCVTRDEDACAGIARGCGGQSITIGCGFHSEPFASFGYCEGDDSDTFGPN